MMGGFAPAAKAGSFFGPTFDDMPQAKRRSPGKDEEAAQVGRTSPGPGRNSPGFVGPSDFGLTITEEGDDEGGEGGEGGEGAGEGGDGDDDGDGSTTIDRLRRVTSLLRDKSTVANRARARGLSMGRGDEGGGGGSRLGGLNEDDNLLLHSMAADLRQLRTLLPAQTPEATTGGAVATAAVAAVERSPGKAPAPGAALARLASEMAGMRASQERQAGQMAAELVELRAEIARLRPPR